MEKVNHTPGPWKFIPAFGRVEVEKFIVAYLSLSVESRDNPLYLTKGEAEANGCLIAAAPELLEALEHVRDFLLIVANEGANQVFLERNAREMIAKHDALLAKARGDGGQGPGVPKVR